LVVFPDGIVEVLLGERGPDIWPVEARVLYDGVLSSNVKCLDIVINILT
jgi:hypothetical protein